MLASEWYNERKSNNTMFLLCEKKGNKQAELFIIFIEKVDVIKCSNVAKFNVGASLKLWSNKLRYRIVWYRLSSNEYIDIYVPLFDCLLMSIDAID